MFYSLRQCCVPCELRTYAPKLGPSLNESQGDVQPVLGHTRQDIVPLVVEVWSLHDIVPVGEGGFRQDIVPVGSSQDAIGNFIPSIERGARGIATVAAAPALRELLAHKDIDIRKTAISLLGRIGLREDIERIIPFLSDEERSTRYRAIVALSLHPSGCDLEAVRPLFVDAAPSVRMEALQYLQARGNGFALAPAGTGCQGLGSRLRPGLVVAVRLRACRTEGLRRGF